MLLTLACGLLACTDPAPLAPEGWRGALLPVQADSMRFTYLCGSRFRVRNPIADTVTVRWDVYGTSDSGSVLLPARPVGQAFSEITFETRVRGTTRLFYAGRLVQTKANGGTVCAAPTVPVEAPNFIPDGLFADSNMVTTGGAPPSRIVRDHVALAFVEGVDQAARQRVLDAIRGVVIGGRNYLPGTEGTYYVRFAREGTAAAVGDVVDRLRAMPEIDMALPLELVTPGDESSYLRPPRGTFEGPSTSWPPPTVPAVAPSFTPPELRDTTRLIEDRAWNPGVRYVRDVLAVLFSMGMPQATRAAAIAAVRGTVIGGRRAFDGSDGVYYVRVPTDGTVLGLYGVLRTLSDQAGVAVAEPLRFGQRLSESRFPAVAPDTLPPGLTDAASVISGEPYPRGVFVRDVLILLFREGTSQAVRAAAIQAVQGTVIGGRRAFDGSDGYYYVRVPAHGSVAELHRRLIVAQRQPGVAVAATWRRNEDTRHAW